MQSAFDIWRAVQGVFFRLGALWYVLPEFFIGLLSFILFLTPIPQLVLHHTYRNANGKPVTDAVDVTTTGSQLYFPTCVVAMVSYQYTYLDVFDEDQPETRDIISFFEALSNERRARTGQLTPKQAQKLK